MAALVLSLCEDVMRSNAVLALPATARMIFVVHGSVKAGRRILQHGQTWEGEAAITLKAGKTGVTAWRWELAAQAPPEKDTEGISSRIKFSARLNTLPQGELLLRGDSVAFPPGGCAYLHRHQGPGIRCLIEGGIRIETQGHSTSYGPGGAWYESGPDPVFAQGAADRPSRFIRVMILPRKLMGKASIQYVNPEDKDKPRVQQYQIFADVPIARPRTAR
jgi:hypothetical protein